MATKGAPWSTLALFVLAGTDANLFALWLLRLLLLFLLLLLLLFLRLLLLPQVMVLANANASLPHTIHVFCTQYRLLERTQGRPLATATQPFWTSSRFQLRTFWDYLSPLQATSIFISSTIEHKIDTIRTWDYTAIAVLAYASNVPEARPNVSERIITAPAISPSELWGLICCGP